MKNLLDSGSDEKQTKEFVRFRQFVFWTTWVAFGFGGIEVLAVILFRDYQIAAAGAITLGYGSSLLVARELLRRGRIKAAVTVSCTGLLVGIVLVALILPIAIPALTILPLVVVALSLSYLQGQEIRPLIMASWGVGIFVAILSEVVAPPLEIPTWFSTIFRVISIVTALGLAFLLMWQFTSRLNETLEQTRAINAKLQNEVNERAQAEEKLRESQERYRQFFENMHETFIIQEIVVNEAGNPIDLRYLDLNPAAERILGKTRTEIVGLTRGQLSGRSDPEGVAMASRVASTGMPFHMLRYSPGFGGWFESFTYSLGSGIVATLSLDITERKQAEDALRESEARLNGIITSTMDAIISVDSEQTVVLFNAAAESMFGCPAAEAVGMQLESFIPERFRAVHREHIGTFGETGVTNRAMNALGIIFGLRANSEEFPIEASISQIELDGKKLFTVILRDITERKRAESQLEYQAHLLANVSDAIIATDEKQVITSWNHAAEELYGWKAEEVLGKLAREAIRSEFTEAQRTEALKALAESGQFRLETLQYRAQGQPIWVEGNTIALRDDRGKPTGFVAVNRDITERKQAEEKLLRSQENFVKAFNSNPAAIAITSLADGKFLDLNPAYTRIMEYERHEILGLTAVETKIYVHPEERDQVVEQLREQGTVQNYELAVRVKSGDTKSVVISMVPILYDEEECILSVFLDISERKKMETELQRSNAELEQFAYIASHDLQEPLRAVAGMVQLLGQRYKGQLDQRADEYIGHAVEASTRMQNLINDLLDYSRVDRMGKPFTSTHLERSLNTALANLQLAVEESGVKITRDPLPVVTADASQITQVLQNLIGNAIKFRGLRPLQIHIGAKKIGHIWQIEISDNGIGIEPQYFERIFLVFQRLHTRREYPGTGIGLALCKKIIERHGGQIWIESQPGQGSKFYFTIPER